MFFFLFATLLGFSNLIIVQVTYALALSQYILHELSNVTTCLLEKVKLKGGCTV
jgi:hypothetical protein